MASREVQAIIDFAEATRLPHRVTSTYRKNPPGRRSYHGATGTGGDGLAVDFAGVTPGITPTTAKQMVDLWRRFRDVAPQLAELIHAGPGITEGVLGGRLVDGLRVFGRDTWADHRDHIHIAVPRGVFLTPPPPPAGSGSGPPTVTVTRYPEGENMLTRHDVDIPALDSQGRGWVKLEIPPSSIVSIVVNGSYPPVDGYWPIPLVARQDRGGATVIEIVDGAPNARTILAVWALG